MTDIERRVSTFVLSNSRFYGHRYPRLLLIDQRLAPNPSPPEKFAARGHRCGGDDRLNHSYPLPRRKLREGLRPALRTKVLWAATQPKPVQSTAPPAGAVSGVAFRMARLGPQGGQLQDLFLIDSCPVEVCENTRIDRCQVIPKLPLTTYIEGITKANANISMD